MSKSILVVEDDEDIARNIALLLTDEGYSVTSAANGRCAFDYLQSAKTLPSLILLDLMMPVMDGFQFREEQRIHPRFSIIPVVVMTADGQFQIKKLTASVRAFVKKPVDIDMFLEVVQECCL